MKKQNLLNFIEKYSLGGEVESVLWKIKNNTIGTTFSHPDRSLLGSIKLNDIKLEDANIGIYTTSELVKLLLNIAFHFYVVFLEHIIIFSRSIKIYYICQNFASISLTMSLIKKHHPAKHHGSQHSSSGPTIQSQIAAFKFDQSLIIFLFCEIK